MATRGGNGNSPSEGNPNEGLSSRFQNLLGNRASSNASQASSSGTASASAAEGYRLGTAKLPIKIRALDGKTTNIEARSDWTVKRLKEEFAEWRGQGWDNVVLHFKARRLNDSDLLSKYNIEADSVILANFRSKGGNFLRQL